jgi:hypothetical protein
LPVPYSISRIKIVVCCLLLAIVCWTAIALPVEASLCRDLDGHRICIVKIKRSAKYHYRYRTVVSIDGETQPLVVYNCSDRVSDYRRSRTITKKNKYPIPFKSNSPGNLVCSLFDK